MLTSEDGRVARCVLPDVGVVLSSGAILTDTGNICMAVRDDSQLSSKQWGINTSTDLSQSVLKLEGDF